MTGEAHPAAQGHRRVIIVGGGASGGLVALQLLRRGGSGLEIVVIEPRPGLALGAAFSTRDPWHRLNVAAATMSALPEDPDHFRRWLGAPPASFASRMDYGRYLQSLLHEAGRESPATLRHLRARAEGLVAGPGGLAVVARDGAEVLAADAVVVATGNELPAVPEFLAAWRGDPRLVVDPWAPGSLDPIADGETVAIIGTGHTALDLAASILRLRPACTVVALSRHGELPRVHEDPWRPRLPEPVFTVDEFRAFADPLAEAEARVRAHGADWRRAMDSLRPIHAQLWRAMDDELRRRFLREWRRTWEVHRSRVPAEAMRDVDRWIGQGRLAVRAARIDRVSSEEGRLRIHAGAGGSGGPQDAPAPGTPSWDVDRILVATGPDERPAANPFLAAAIDAGLLRAHPLGLGLDMDPDTGRAFDASGTGALPVYAMGPLRRGAIWESIAIPEIRAQAAEVAMALVGGRA